MFDLQKDPNEMVNVFEDKEYEMVREKLVNRYQQLRMEYEAPEYESSKK